mmetsp:Transcript_16700/g.28928  ORF Transcript_16700/g.28928 Transcript_16700/m.28928 type:complete len:171 (+) Transcript_16700:313-825(+)
MTGAYDEDMKTELFDNVHSLCLLVLQVVGALQLLPLLHLFLIVIFLSLVLLLVSVVPSDLIVVLLSRIVAFSLSIFFILALSFAVISLVLLPVVFLSVAPSSLLFHCPVFRTSCSRCGGRGTARHQLDAGPLGPRSPQHGVRAHLYSSRLLLFALHVEDSHSKIHFNVRL